MRQLVGERYIKPFFNNDHAIFGEKSTFIERSQNRQGNIFTVRWINKDEVETCLAVRWEMNAGHALGQIMLDDLEAVTAINPGKTKVDIFFYEVKGSTVVVNENDIIRFSTQGFEAHGPSSGKKVKEVCTLDGFAKDTEQGFPRLVRGWSNTHVMKGRCKEFSTFCYPTDNSQKFTKPRRGLALSGVPFGAERLISLVEVPQYGLSGSYFLALFYSKFSFKRKVKIDS